MENYVKSVFLGENQDVFHYIWAFKKSVKTKYNMIHMLVLRQSRIFKDDSNDKSRREGKRFFFRNEFSEEKRRGKH